MKIICIPEAASTNSWVASYSGETDKDFMVYAVAQTAGRGQRGNSWESEPGKNITASALLHPVGIIPARQFIISEAVALAVTDLLAEIGIDAMVKWPNDIYVGDRKICGILIEHSIMPGKILRTIAGIGINVNQQIFRSDAPNPVSVVQLTGATHDIPSLVKRLATHLERRMEISRNEEVAKSVSSEVENDRAGNLGINGDKGNLSSLHEEFMQKLWRGDGSLYPFFDRKVNEEIKASVLRVAPDGMLTLKIEDGEERTYVFKEIEFLL